MNETVTIGFQFATGSDNPVSTNQTLTGGFSSKSVNTDEAFFQWQPHLVKQSAVIGGKMENPFVSPGKSELIWDTDLRPEGLAYKYSFSPDTLKLFINAAYFWVEERPSDNDAVMLGGQGGIMCRKWNTDFVLGLGYFDYQNARYNAPFYNSHDSFGNSVDSNGGYLYDYNEIEIMGSLVTHRLFTESSLFFDSVVNTAPGVKDNLGWLGGFSMGTNKKPGSVSLRYSYQIVEKDALIGAFTDSDFIDGGTDGKGHKISITFQIAQNSTCEATYFHNQKGIDHGEKYRRGHLALNFKI